MAWGSVPGRDKHCSFTHQVNYGCVAHLSSNRTCSKGFSQGKVKITEADDSNPS